MVEDQEKNVPAVVEVADDGDARKEKKERHKKDKKHKHKHKHKSGHKRHREEEDGAEVETVPAAVKPGSSEPERRANGKVTHDVADKAGSDCESGEIPTAEDITGVANESGAAGDGDGPSAAGQPLGTDDGQGIDENGTERRKRQDADKPAPHKRPREGEEGASAPDAKRKHHDSRSEKSDRALSRERHDSERPRSDRAERSAVPKESSSAAHRDSDRRRDHDRDERRKEDRHPRTSKERRGEDSRDRHRHREHSPGRDRDVREREHRDRDIRDRDRDPRAAGRDVNPRAGRYEADRDRSFRAPSRDRERERYLDRERDRDRGRAAQQGRYGGRENAYDRNRDRDRAPDRRNDRRDDRRPREPVKTKEELEEEARREAELAAQMEAALEGAEDEEQRLIEERRKRRQQILAKHQQDRELSKRVAAPTASELQSNGFMDTPGRTPGMTPGIISGASPSILSADAAASRGVSPTPGSLPVSPARPAQDALSRPQSASHLGKPGSDLEDDEEEEEDVARMEQGEDLWQTRRDDAAAERGPGEPALGEAEAGEGPLAADADDPAVRDSEDEKKHKLEAQAARHHDTLDIFAEQVDDDMFGAGPAAAGPGGGAVKKGLLDNYDDVEGYYNFQVGEIMDDRYEVFDTLGKGVFSTVLRARDTAHKNVLGKHPEVAVKVIRSNDVMYKAGQTEMVILRKLSGADPAGKRHCVRMLRSFEYRQHLCLVFESMDLNLRELTKKYGRGIGLNIRAVRPYAAQMFWALYHLANCGVLHSDIKPDNILVSEDRTSVKLCDFGSAMFQGENEVTPYLVSRYYRAPEVILGLKYDTPMDMWSIGCVVYELYTGKILFPGRSNNEMLKLMMDVGGAFPKKMLRKGAFADRHFDLKDPNCAFYHIEEDPVTKQPVRRIIANPVAKKRFPALLAGSEGDKRQVAQLADLLERMVALDPEKRITPKEALRHPFIKGPAATASARK